MSGWGDALRLISGTWRRKLREQFPQGGLARRAVTSPLRDRSEGEIDVGLLVWAMELSVKGDALGPARRRRGLLAQQGKKYVLVFAAPPRRADGTRMPHARPSGSLNTDNAVFAQHQVAQTFVPVEEEAEFRA